MLRCLVHALRVAADKATRPLASMWPDQRGVSAIEFSLFAGMLSISVLNVVDISAYIYKRMEAENATQMGAQAAWKACNVNQLPATTNCPGLNSAITKAIQSTSLGSAVSLQAGSPTEGYYCLNDSGTLQHVSSVSSRPTDCSAAGHPDAQPEDYIQISTSFAYAPLFPGITVAGAFTTPITKTSWMRLD